MRQSEGRQQIHGTEELSQLQLIIIFLGQLMSDPTKRRVSPEKMLKQAQKTKGYLFKKSSGLLSGWNKRYFIILNGALTYYGDEALEKLKGEIKIREISSIIIKDNDSFILETPKRQYEFKCQNILDRDLWVASLNLLREYTQDGQSTSKVVVKKTHEKEPVLSSLCKMEDVRKILIMMKLNILSQQIDQPRIRHRIYCQKVVQGYLISVSVKCLEFTEIDEEILGEHYITPYHFNRLYKVHNDGRVEDIAKMSNIHSLKTQGGFVNIGFSDKKKTFIPYKNEQQADTITRKLYRCYEVAKQYYNPFKIVLKKNIDRIAYLYDSFRQLFQEQTILRVNTSLNRYKICQSDHSTCFITDFKLLKNDLIETQEACKVASPSRDDIKQAYFKIVHEQARHSLSHTWETLFGSFTQKNLISLSCELYEYWLVINKVVADSSIIEGCNDLNRFFMSRAGEVVKEKIHQLNAQKVVYYKMKNEPVGNQLTNVFYQWLIQVNGCLAESVPLESIFDQYCRFYWKCFDQFLEFLCEASDKWSEILVLIGSCNDLVRIRKYVKSHISSQTCKGIFAEKKFYASCGDEIVKRLNECMGILIRKAFIIFFKNIDKKLLTRPFLEIDFSKICYEVLQRVEPYKSRLLEQAEYQMLILSFDEICFFFYTILISKNVPLLKNVREYYIKAIEKGVTEIDQYYCNIKTETYVKSYLQQVLNLREMLTCSEFSLQKVTSQLHLTFGSSFNQESILTMLTIRQVQVDSFQRLFDLCKQGLSKASSSQDSDSCLEMQMRSRKSTLTESIYTIQTPERIKSKTVKEGYLDMKKITKGVPNFYIYYYIRIKDGHVLGYSTSSSTEIIFSIELDQIELCYLDTQTSEKCIFIIVLGPDNFHFKASNRDEAGSWVQAVYSQIKHPLFENRSAYPEEKKNAIFKNMDAELATTTTQKLRIVEVSQQEKFMDIKKGNRIKVEEQKDKQKEKSSKQRMEKKKSKVNNSNQEDEGCCCGGSIF